VKTEDTGQQQASENKLYKLQARKTEVYTVLQRLLSYTTCYETQTKIITLGKQKQYLPKHLSPLPRLTPKEDGCILRITDYYL
jgi:hypothetical protein